jgi:TrmH family RNA methyltransferase
MTRPPVREITSPANSLIKDIRALHMKKRRDETGLFIAEGARVVMEALDCGVAPRTLIYAKSQQDADIVRKLRSKTISKGGEALEVGAAILGKLARKDNPQSVLAVFEQRYAALAEVAPSGGAFWVALEGVKDPGNLGAVVRTADAAGAAGVILVGATCDPYSVEAVRATMGSIFAVPIFRATTNSFAAFCARFPGPIVGTAPQADADYRAARYAKPTLLLMGAEQSGLSAQARALCTTLVKLPMKGRADSLNLAVATGVMLYQLADALETSARS